LSRGLLRCRAVIREIERGLVALGEGRPVRPTNTKAPGAMGRLARTFDATVPELQERISRLDRDVEQLRVVLGGMAEGVIAIDARRRLLFANKSADLLFGLSPQAVGRLVPELIRSPRFQEAVDATLAGPETYRGEITLPSRDVLPRSIPRVLAIHGSILPGSPPSGAVLVFHDVTELRRLERMRQDFVANVSHELKTPLASIKAYTETLIDGGLHDENVNVRFLNRIEEQADRLNQLILDLLSLARLESGHEVFQHGPLALSAVVETCIETHRGRAEAKELDLGLNLGPVDEATLVVADEEAVHQILDNLIDNAIKYTPSGGWVRVDCQIREQGVELAVADSGIGIPRDDLPRVFERFYRVDKARSREMGGTGLGLSIVKHLIQSIGGQITVDSRLGEGTRFTVLLPRYQPKS
jgi:two-component system phosphate regulon sensor histidine kinase PhoR